jgi:Holliday junction resolvase RusA-like endonuclease
MQPGSGCSSSSAVCAGRSHRKSVSDRGMANWTEAQLTEFYKGRGVVPAAPATHERAEVVQRKPRVKPNTAEPVSGPMEWSAKIYGHCPSKKNLWARGKAGIMFLPEEVKEKIATITTQLMFAWKYSGPVVHPDITIRFYVAEDRKSLRKDFRNPTKMIECSIPKGNRDRDGMFTTLLDCMQAAGILVNDNIQNNNGTVVIEPCGFVKDEDERVEIRISKAGND